MRKTSFPFPRKDLRTPTTRMYTMNIQYGQYNQNTGLIVLQQITCCWHTNEMESAGMTAPSNSLKGGSGWKPGQGSTNPIAKQIHLFFVCNMSNFISHNMYKVYYIFWKYGQFWPIAQYTFSQLSGNCWENSADLMRNTLLIGLFHKLKTSQKKMWKVFCKLRDKIYVLIVLSLSEVSELRLQFGWETRCCCTSVHSTDFDQFSHFHTFTLSLSHFHFQTEMRNTLLLHLWLW